MKRVILSFLWLRSWIRHVLHVDGICPSREALGKSCSYRVRERVEQLDFLGFGEFIKIVREEAWICSVFAEGSGDDCNVIGGTPTPETENIF